jgi:hypothetical protein
MRVTKNKRVYKRYYETIEIPKQPFAPFSRVYHGAHEGMSMQLGKNTTHEFHMTLTRADILEMMRHFNAFLERYPIEKYPAPVVNDPTEVNNENNG